MKTQKQKSTRTKKAFRLRHGLYGLFKLTWQKKELLTIVIDKHIIKFHTNGEVDGLPPKWEHSIIINNFPILIVEKLALIPNKFLGKGLITSKK